MAIAPTSQINYFENLSKIRKGIIFLIDHCKQKASTSTSCDRMHYKAKNIIHKVQC